MCDNAIRNCEYYQQHVKPSSSQWHEYERVIWDNKEKKKKEEMLVESLENEWDKHAGPFIRLLDSSITSLKVKRQRYHGGTFVGNDCIRLLNGREQLSHVLKPQLFYSPKGKKTIIGSDEQSKRIFGLLDRLWHLHRLYSAARPLCRHEVSIVWDFSQIYTCQHVVCAALWHVMLLHDVNIFVHVHLSLGC